ncbi:MAG: transposase [Clostridiales Family XIII bacterium]|jgi:hypothetical protein|nr:transposase [Clostridiales Family XIII bacterium]
MTKVSMKSRREIIEKQYDKYQKSTKKQKSKILDAVCESTGISRDRAARILACKPPPRSRPKTVFETRGRKTVYGEDVLEPLKKIWSILGCVCGKRVAAGMAGMLDALLRHGEIEIEEEIAAKLKRMSPATIDRLLKKERERITLKGRSTTKPGSLLKKDIPIRMGTAWNDAVPGFVEIDLVAHCGDTTAGEYLNTLDATDIATAWTETRASVNKAQKHVFAELMIIKSNLPFDLLGIDSDNGSEFINDELYRYCKQENICFTRSRPYQKNDGCYVEQKNWSVVRKEIGYDRYEGKEAADLMNEYYGCLRLLTNFFMPTLKLKSRIRDGTKVYKTYEDTKTPYARVLESDDIPQENKDALTELYLTINPFEIRREMVKISGRLTALRIPYRQLDK